MPQELTVDKLKEALFGMATNKVFHPHGFNIEFYQKEWKLVKMIILGYHKITVMRTWKSPGSFMKRSLS
jgi:hypothetical protein